MADSYKAGSVFAPIYAALYDVLSDCMSDIKDEMSKTRAWSKSDPGRHAPYKVTATGKTAASLAIEPTVFGLRLVGRENFLNMEGGTPPGRRPNPSDLLVWARARKIWLDEKGAKRLADKIEKKGDQLFNTNGGREPFVTPLLQAAADEAAKVVENNPKITEGVLRNIEVFLNI